ncbi:MAG: glycosyltransferase [Candidatus Bathyarchaeia archaeon]
MVLYVGRLDPCRGVRYLLEAIPLIAERVRDVEFMVIGSPRYDSPVIGELIKKPEVKRSLIFTGYVDDKESPYFYALRDVFYFTSLWEGFGLPPAEAQACGKPVVAFNNCALPEVAANGISGILVPPRDSKALGEAVAWLLQDDHERMGMGDIARRRAEKPFRWDNTAEETMSLRGLLSPSRILAYPPTAHGSAQLHRTSMPHPMTPSIVENHGSPNTCDCAISPTLHGRLTMAILSPQA